MTKYEKNHKLLSDLKGVPKNIVRLFVAGATQIITPNSKCKCKNFMFCNFEIY